LEAFATEINRKLDIVDPTPQEKRTIFELLHLKVIIGIDGELGLQGWFEPLDDFSSTEGEMQLEGEKAVANIGLLDRTSSCRVIPAPYLPRLRR